MQVFSRAIEILVPVEIDITLGLLFRAGAANLNCVTLVPI